MRATMCFSAIATVFLAACGSSQPAATDNSDSTETLASAPADAATAAEAADASGSSEGTDGSPATPSDSDLLAYGQTQTKEALEAKLKDADSAKYKNVAAYHIPSLGPGYAFCGEVNAKNSFGAYEGYERFVGVPGQVFLESEVSDFGTVWKTICNPRQKAPPIWW